MPASPPGPPDEAARLAALRDLLVLDSPPERLFDMITRLASELCGTPIALISLIDQERQWFKASVGLQGVNETPRDLAFCAHAIRNDGLFEVPNATLDARFADNPLVTGTPDIRFYAGAPLILPDGSRAGTLCVIDRLPGHLDDQAARLLQALAALASEALVMRRDLIKRSLSVRSDYEQALARGEAERQRAEQALRESQALLDRTGRIARIGGWHADLGTGAMFWSDQTCRIHDLEPGHSLSLEQAIGFLADDGRAVVENAIKRSVDDGQPWDVELRIVTATQRSIWVRMVGEVEVEAGRAVRLIGTVQDITERRQRKAELLREQVLRLQVERHAQELDQLLHEREEMTQVLAHEVRQPLNNASAALQSAAAVLRDVGEQAASLRLGRAQGVMGQVLASIDNTLAVASLLARQEAVTGADTDIDTLVAVVLADMPASARHRIRVERLASSRTVSADMSLLRLALRNLLINALAYSPPDAPVVVRLIDSDDPLALLIDVEDEGGGFSAELVPRLFERGTRGRHKDGTPGHGLGLYIVRRVMELHGGRVELARNTPVGSTLRLVIEQALGD